MEGSSVVCVTGLEIVLRNVHWHRAEHEALETPVQEDKDCVGGLALRGLRGHGCFKLGPLGRSPFTSFGSHDGSPRLVWLCPVVLQIEKILDCFVRGRTPTVALAFFLTVSESTPVMVAPRDR